MLNASLSRPHLTEVADPGASRVLICGKSFTADQTGALFWPAENCLIVADLRLSQCSYLAGHDVILPPYDTASAFEKLEEALDRYDPERVIALGDSFAVANGDTLTSHQKDWLLDMMEGRDWYWVTSTPDGSHPDGVGGAVVPHMTTGGIKFRAEPLRAPVSHEIAAALHPIATVTQYGHATRGRCFVTNGARMILPSLGNYGAGSNVLSDLFDPLLGRGGMFVWMIADGRVIPVAPALLVEDCV